MNGIVVFVTAIIVSIKTKFENSGAPIGNDDMSWELMYTFMTMMMYIGNIQFFSFCYKSVTVILKLTMLQGLDGEHGESKTGDLLSSSQ